MQSKVVAASCCERLASRSRPPVISHVVAPSSCAMLSRCRASSSTTSTRRTPCGELRFEPLERLDQLLALDRLQRVADGAAFQRLLRVVGDRDHVHRDVARARVALELVEHAEARSGRAG